MTDATARTELAVWGDPIEHSRSPRLHAAAYDVLGLPWTYGRRRVDAAEFADALAGLGPQWRGLSCTMPLKEVAFRAAVVRDRRAELTGSVNTLLLGADGPVGANTDVGGLVEAMREHGVDELETARILGAGRTAASALVALTELDARVVHVHARRAEAITPLVELGAELGVRVVPHPLTGSADAVDVTVATLPGGTELSDAVTHALAQAGGLLLDAAYDPWPSSLASAWERAGRTAVSGLSMLLHQAVLQVRLFVTGSTEDALPDEAAVVAAMRRALDA